MVSDAWLRERLHQPDVCVVDGSWYLPGSGRDARAEYAAAHIPGAVFFDIEVLSDSSTSLPHMLPDADRFAAAVGGLGIRPDDRVVVYDGAGLFSAARVWWTFRAFGHERVAVLDGGLPRWRARGGPVTSAATVRAPQAYEARSQPALVRTIEQMRSNLQTQASLVIDARPRDRFEGEVPEPRSGVRSGHIPASINLPYTDLLREGALQPPEALRRQLTAMGVAPDTNITATCGSGVTASIVALAFYVLGNPNVAVYDGSWAEWGSLTETPVETGPAGSRPSPSSP